MPQKDNFWPIILFLLMLTGGIIIAFLGDQQNDLHRFCFIILVSLGAGLGATYLTGKITGEGKFGFINITSASGGTLIWAITFATFIYFFPKPNIDREFPTMTGKWLYICTGHDGKYQHGGRFTAIQNEDVWSLKGERMWKDTINTKGNRWDTIVYRPTRSWRSLSGNIDNNEIRCEYLVENIEGEDIHGYFHGSITVDDSNHVIRAKGIFNQLFPSKQLSGDIEFYKIPDSIYNNPQWRKNH